jgi:cytochrome c553
MTRAWIAGALVIAAQVPTLAGAGTALQASPPGDPSAGQRAFSEYVCYYCHGTEGQGSSQSIGPRIATTPRSFESFVRYVRRPSGRMSTYADTSISDATLADIYAFLRSLPASKKSAEVPLLDQLRQR